MGKQRRKPAYRPYSVGAYRLGWLLGEFVAVWYEDGQRRRHRLGVAEETQARTELHAFARAHLKLASEPVVTVTAFKDQYIEDRKQEGVSTDKPRWLWSALGPVFGHMRPCDITKQHCRDYAAARAALGRRPASIYGELQMLRTIMNWAVKNKLLKSDEMPTLWAPPAPDPRDRHLTREEVNRLLVAAELPHARLFIVLAICTAARKTALLELTWDRVDFDRGLIYLRDPEVARTSKGRATVPMNDTARAALLEAKLGGVTNHVIEWAGKPVGDIKKTVSTALRKSGLKVKGDGAHLLRHSAAVFMAEDGVPMSEISQYLGHSNTSTTEKIYARFSTTYLQKAASSLNLPAVHLQSSAPGSR
jgi:integrase